MPAPARYLAPVLVVAMALALGACGMKQSIAHSEQDVALFHQRYDAGKFEEIWDSGAPDLHASTTKAQFLKLLGAIQRKLGPVKSSERQGWTANTGTSGSYVTVTMQTVFAHGSGTETLTFRKDGGKDGGGQGDGLALAGYHIASQDMLLN